jgi:hypothetical protein
MQAQRSEPLRYEAVEGKKRKTSSGAQSVDSVLDAVSVHVQNGEWHKVGERAREALLDGADDIRLSANYYVACFIAGSQLEFAPLLSRLDALLNQESKAREVRSIRNLASVIQLVLRHAWEFTRFRSTLRDEHWRRWTENYRALTWKSDLAAAQQLLVTVQARREDEKNDANDDEKDSSWDEVESSLLKLNRWLKESVPTLISQVHERAALALVAEDVGNQVNSDATSEDKDSAKMTSGPADADDEAVPNPQNDRQAKISAFAAAQGGDSLGVHHSPVPASEPHSLEVSAYWLRLDARMRTFTTLVESGKFIRAAVLAADIEEELANFEPARYFPASFSAFFRALTLIRAREAAGMAMIDQGTLAALRAYARSDLAAFSRDDELDGAYSNE